MNADEVVEHDLATNGLIVGPTWRNGPTCPGWWIVSSTTSAPTLTRYGGGPMLVDPGEFWFGPVPRPPHYTPPLLT